MTPYRNGTGRAQVIELLRDCGALTSAQLSAELGINPSALSSFVRDGVLAGHIERQKIPNAHGYTYTLTEKAPSQRERYASVWGYGQGVEV